MSESKNKPPPDAGAATEDDGSTSTGSSTSSAPPPRPSASNGEAGGRTRPSGAPPAPKAPPSEAGRRKPLLASEVLKDDIAPVEPLARSVKYWGAATAILFLALGFSPAATTGLGGAPSDSATAHWALGGLCLAASVIPLRYWWRAAALLLLSVVGGLLGVTGRGPAGAVADGAGEWGLLHLLACVALPAALLFRARYRAFPGARFLLAAALVLTVPFAIYAVMRLLHAGLPVQLVSAVALGVVLLSLLGFMGSETTGAGDVMAAGLIIAITGQIGAEAIASVGGGLAVRGVLWSLASITAFAAAAAVGSIGLFQLLAWRLGPLARAVDTRTRPPAERPRKHSVADWLTRR